ncbi:hypothetical protein C8T65DRAFT_708447 [Cerioporus squamosus]|nr:hypothetical protein C8T65DRAFT_708447 [Cerioporus squamosus]
MPLPTHYQSSNRNLPRRTDSLKPTKAPYFNEVDDELRDIRRVHSQGQEEDLRYALSRTINRIEELTSMLKEAYKAQADLQTELTLAKSNLQMALANNEMLEDALKRDPGHSKDVGWRRMSAREQNLKAEAEADRRRSTDSLTSTDLLPAPDHSPVVPRSATMPSPAPSNENRFFRFRFGNGNGANATSSHPSSPRLVCRAVTYWDKELEDLKHQLEAERKAHQSACDAKTALEAELESLSQALFEEANKMVATERRKRAETEEALREAREQGEALKNVLRLFERDTAAARARSSAVEVEAEGGSAAQVRSRHRASSSAVGIKSPSSGIPSPQSRPSTPTPPPGDVPESARTITPGPTTTPGSSSNARPGEKRAGHTEGVSTDTFVSSLPEPSASGNPAPVATPPSTTLQIYPPVLADADSPSPTPSPVPSPLSAPGQFLFAAPRAVNYYDGEESPWADAPSAASPKITS